MISAPCLGVYYFLSLTLSVFPFVTNIASFLFLDGIEPFLGHQFSMTKTTKLFFFDFPFRPPNVKNLLPKICTKSPITRLVWQIVRRYLHLPGDFRGSPIQWNHAKCCGANPCCHGSDIWARRGDLVAYQLVLFFSPGVITCQFFYIPLLNLDNLKSNLVFDCADITRCRYDYFETCMRKVLSQLTSTNTPVARQASTITQYSACHLFV